MHSIFSITKQVLLASMHTSLTRYTWWITSNLFAKGLFVYSLYHTWIAFGQI